MSDHGHFSSYENHKERRTGKIHGAFSRMHRALDGWMLARAPASPAQGLHHHGPRYSGGSDFIPHIIDHVNFIPPFLKLRKKKRLLGHFSPEMTTHSIGALGEPTVKPLQQESSRMNQCSFMTSIDARTRRC